MSNPTNAIATRHRIPPETILGAVETVFDTNRDDIFIRTRHRERTEPRFAFFLAARCATGLSWQNIGKLYGKYNHATVMHGYQTILNLYFSDPIVRERVDLLARIMKNPRLDTVLKSIAP